MTNKIQNNFVSFFVLGFFSEMIISCLNIFVVKQLNWRKANEKYELHITKKENV
jgi:hypothetical protein